MVPIGHYLILTALLFTAVNLALVGQQVLVGHAVVTREAVTDVARNYSLAHGTRVDLLRAAEVCA